MLAPASASASLPSSRLVNPGAEEGLAGWQGSGFGFATYDDSGVPRFPAPNFVPGPAPDLGARLFSAPADGAIWQSVDLSDLAATIDSGAQPLSVGGLLGGRGGQDGGARLVAQPLDAAGAALGAPYVVGHPTDRDRQSRTALLPCNIHNQIAPVGTRAVLVRLEAVGHGLADRLFLSTERFAFTAALHAPTRVADGPRCLTGELVGPWPPGAPPAPPAPTLRLLVTMPASDRCGRKGPLRFAVHRRWRSTVKSLEVRARGKRIIRTAHHMIKIAPPRGTLRVALHVKLRDGREQASTQRFYGCSVSQ